MGYGIASVATADFFNIPVLRAIEYFTGMIGTALYWASLYGKIFGLIGLLWSAFQLINSRLAIKDFLWNTFYKWTLFFFLVSCYGMVINFFSSVGNEVGIKVGGGTEYIEESLNTMYNGILQDKETARNRELNSAINKQLEKKASIFSNAGIDIYKDFDTNNYNAYLNTMQNQIEASGLSSISKDSALKTIQKAREDAYKEANESLNNRDNWIITAIDEVTTRVYPNGNKTGDITKSYLTLNMWMYDESGRKTIYLSPASMFRLSLLSCNIRTWKVTHDYEEKKAEIATLGTLETIKQSLPLLLEVTCNRIINAVGNLVIIIATVFAMIQYMMTILEYTIISGIGAIFLPLILFDGTKDIPKKLIPVFVNMMIKLIVITSCLIFSFWLIIHNTTISLSEGLEGAWTSIATTILNCVLVFVLTSNAPKIAQTILTGQPQLSMGEFVAGAGALWGTAKVTGKVAKGAEKLAGNTVRKTANTGANFVAHHQKIKGATEVANTMTEGKGKDGKLTTGQKFANRVKAGLAVNTTQAMNAMGNKWSSFLQNGNSGKGGGAGIGSGMKTKYNQTGTKQDGSPLSTTSNNNFLDAKMFDKDANQERSMTFKERKNEAYNQGAMLMTQKAEEKKAKKKKKEEKNASITGGERLSDNTAQKQEQNQNTASDVPPKFETEKTPTKE